MMSSKRENSHVSTNSSEIISTISSRSSSSFKMGSGSTASAKVTPSGSRVDYDNVLRYIGQCGKWQWINFFLLWLTSAAGGLAVVVWAFTAYTQTVR